MLRKSVLSTACVALTLLHISGRAHAENLLVYGDEVYPPVIYMERGKPAGILPAIFGELEKETGDNYELVLVPWKRALYEASFGNGGITNFSWNKDRASAYDFSESIYNDDIQLIVLKGREFDFKELADLKGKRVGGAAGASYGDEVDQAIEAGVIKVDRDPHQLSRLRKLLLGRIDVAFIGNGNAGFEQLLASDPDLSANRSKFVVLPKPLVRDPLFLAFEKSMNKKSALERFNKALKALKRTARYRQLVGQ